MRTDRPRPGAGSAPPRLRLPGIAFTFVVTAIGTVMAIYSLPSFLLTFGGMAPAMMAYLTDETPGKYAFRAVAAFNLAGLAPYLIESLSLANTMSAALLRATDVSMWFTIYGAAMIGWLLVWFAPRVASVVISATIEQRIKRAVAARGMLAKEWDFEEAPSEGD